jgi:polyribonucleotide nucleotidyltransferase
LTEKHFIMNENQKSEQSKFEFNLGEKKLIFEIDQLATKSDKSILCRYGDTTILTALIVKELTQDCPTSFFPLTISVEEKFYSVGRIPTTFNKREGRPSCDAITTARLIDRSLRSFFPLGSNQEVQIINHILSVDPECEPSLAAA